MVDASLVDLTVSTMCSVSTSLAAKVVDAEHRALDNVLVELLWQSVKYEEVYLKDYVSVPDAGAGLTHYFASTITSDRTRRSRIGRRRGCTVE